VRALPEATTSAIIIPMIKRSENRIRRTAR
jgi:hypothetical protein